MNRIKGESALTFVRRLMLPIYRSLRLLIPPLDEAIHEVRPVSGRLAPLGDLEDVAGGREVKRRVERASDRAGVVVEHLYERRRSGRDRDARLPHLIDRRSLEQIAPRARGIQQSIHVIAISHSGHGGERQADVRGDPADQELLPPGPPDGLADARLIPGVDHAALDVLHLRQGLRELRQRRPPHHGRRRGEHDRDAEDARGAGERDDIVAHLIRLDISDA